MMHSDDTQERSQGFRSVHKRQRPSTTAASPDADDIIFIVCHFGDNDSQQPIIFWEDIQQAFEKALHVRVGTQIVSFLRGQDRKLLEPHRIAFVPGVVLDVVVGGELAAVEVSSLERGVQDLSLRQPPPSATPRNPAYGLQEQAMENYAYIDRPAVARSPSQESQAIVLDRPEYRDRGNFSSGSPLGSATNQRPDNAQDDSAGTTKDLLQAIISATQGHVEVQVAVGDMYRKGQGVIRDYHAAMAWYLTAADQGHLRAQYNIGLLYANDGHLECVGEPKYPSDDSDRDDHGLLKDHSKAFGWFLKAARQGLVEAQVMAALLLIFSHDANVKDSGPATISAIVQWIFEAAKQNNAKAQFCMGVFYEQGFGIPKSNSMAFEWLLKAAEQGHKEAQHCVGEYYDEGEVTSKDDAKAFQWFHKAAKQDVPAAMFQVAFAYFNGLGVKENPSAAIQWLTKAAELGDASAQHFLATTYVNGRVVAISLSKAIKWALKSAKQGDVDGQFLVGEMYENGQGVLKDLSEAKGWYLKAADNGSEKAKVCLERLSQSEP